MSHFTYAYLDECGAKTFTEQALQCASWASMALGDGRWGRGVCCLNMYTSRVDDKNSVGEGRKEGQDHNSFSCAERITYVSGVIYYENLLRDDIVSAVELHILRASCEMIILSAVFWSRPVLLDELAQA